MNRREFGKMIAGTGVAATIPVSGMASAAVASAQRSKYVFAVALAHNRVDVSAEMITEMFDVRPNTARRLLSKLVKNGVVDTPNAQGVARLAKPLQRIIPQVVEYNPAGGYIVKGPLDDLTTKAQDLAERILKTDPDESDMAKSTLESDSEAEENSNSENPVQLADQKDQIQ